MTMPGFTADSSLLLLTRAYATMTSPVDGAKLGSLDELKTPRLGYKRPQRLGLADGGKANEYARFRR